MHCKDWKSSLAITFCLVTVVAPQHPVRSPYLVFSLISIHMGLVFLLEACTVIIPRVSLGFYFHHFSILFQTVIVSRPYWHVSKDCMSCGERGFVPENQRFQGFSELTEFLEQLGYVIVMWPECDQLVWPCVDHEHLRGLLRDHSRESIRNDKVPSATEHTHAEG